MSTILDTYAAGAAELLGGPTFCSVTMSIHGSTLQVASTDPRAEACDRVEIQMGDGPCLLAMRQLHSVLLEDLDAETIWPHWRQAARDAGFRSFLALPAIVSEDVTVAANVYSETLSAWTALEVLAVDAYIQELAGELRAAGWR